VLTIKGTTTGITRPEFEYTIPHTDALELLDMCVKPLIHKTRYHVDVNGSLWEVDVFGGANAGLIIAEIELATEDTHFNRPDWLLGEVTGDVRYGNSSLVQAPYSSWGSDL
jgi:adenylate cyclase